jgi:hypothetical protein
MQNLFNFEYQENALFNLDGSKSNFRTVYGKDGQIITCPKGSYHIVKTEDISSLGNAFLDKGYNVSTFDHRNGEKIGLNVSFGSKKTNVGDCDYNLLISVPNNGAGKGYLSIKQNRLICTNGMVSSKTMHKDNSIKIPHTWNYKQSIELMKQRIDGFTSLLGNLEQKDTFFNGQKMNDTEVLFKLNEWFYNEELPTSHKKDMTFNEFRKLTAIAPNEIKLIDRYNQLLEAFNREVEYNSDLGLEMSMYTTFASVTNYLSRRVESSTSVATNEVKMERASKKLEFFDKLVTI